MSFPKFEMYFPFTDSNYARLFYDKLMKYMNEYNRY